MTAMRQLCVRLVAFGLLFLVLAWVPWPIAGLSRELLVAAAVCFVVATIARIKMWRDANADPYSLNSLNEMIREGTYSEDDVPEIDHEGDKYCLCCHTVYGSQFGVCPNCAKK